MNLNYVTPDGTVADTELKMDYPGSEHFLHHMVKANPDTIFFYTIPTTDIF